MFGGGSKSGGGGAASGRGPAESEEAIEMRDQILQLLLAGGYFRARIAGLSPFDKVIGGMAWSITAASGDLDIDIFFQEDAQIGQKIKLGEQVLDGLHRLGCPLRLQTHQIMGLDYKNIFGVIRWLVKKVIEVRAETGDLVRAYSETHFKRQFVAPAAAGADEADEAATGGVAAAAVAPPSTAATGFVDSVNSVYRPKRRFGRRTAERSESEEVQLTLLEYGSRMKTGRADDQHADKKKRRAAGGGEPDDGQQKRQDEEEAEYRARMQRMAELGPNADAVSDRSVQGFIPTNQLQQLVDAYERGADGTDGASVGPLQAKKIAEKQHRYKLDALAAQISALEDDSRAVQERHDQARATLDAARTALAERQAVIDKLNEELARFNAMETPENAAHLAALKALVAENDQLKTQETEFRRQCKEQMADLKSRIAALAATDVDTEEARQMARIEEAEARDADKLGKIRELLAEKNRELARVERAADSYPSRIELRQYQRMFVELYAVIAHRERETRQYYQTFNTLSDTKTYLTKELSIYESLLSQYTKAIKSKASREAMLNSMQEILESVEAILSKVSSKLADDKARKNELSDRYMALTDNERQYLAISKVFQEQCELSEKLSQQLDEAAGDA